MENQPEQNIIREQLIVDFYNHGNEFIVHDIENNINGHEAIYEDNFVVQPHADAYPDLANNIILYTGQYNNYDINYMQWYTLISDIYQTIDNLRQTDAANVENIANNDLEAQVQVQAEGQEAEGQEAQAEEDNIQPFHLFPEIEQEQVIDVDIVVEEEYQDPMSVLLCVPISQETFGDCSICYKQMIMANLTITRCGHAFHASCLNTALEVRCTCPLCRTQLVIEELD
jgi:hypothetical protein